MDLFAPLNIAGAPMNKAIKMSTYWEGHPPSSVLGLGANIPSSVFGPISAICFVAGAYCIHDSNILHTFGAASANPTNLELVLGAHLVPYSWG